MKNELVVHLHCGAEKPSTDPDQLFTLNYFDFEFSGVGGHQARFRQVRKDD